MGGSAKAAKATTKKPAKATKRSRSSSSSDSSSSSSSSSSESDSSSTSDSSSESSSDDSESASSTDSDGDSGDGGLLAEKCQLEKHQKEALAKLQQLEIGLEPYVATNIGMLQAQRQQQQAALDQKVVARFKEIYMEYVTTGFGSDLDALRKEGAMDDEGLD
ncbi:hypothetical protein LPJ61_006974, partial [Coemansia biformis]